MKTLNSDLLCSIDTETTGLQAGFHEVIELGLVPLGLDLKPDNTISPFSMLIKPEHFDRIDKKAMQVNKIPMSELTGAQTKEVVLDVFEDWFDVEITSKGFNKIQVLAQNWAFDNGFLQRLFGWASATENLMDEFFNLRKGVRDTKTAACYINDLAEYNNQPIPFPKTSLTYLCSQLNIERSQAHRALGDCYDTAEVYRRFMFYLQGAPIAI